MEAGEARDRLAAARVAHLATADFAGQPHLVAICFALAGEVAYTAIDHKPKTTMNLRRLRNITMNARVSLLADHYEDDDWTRLWWVRADGSARVLDDAEPEREHALGLLVDRYRQYRVQPPAGPVIAIDVERWVGWAAGQGS